MTKWWQTKLFAERPRMVETRAVQLFVIQTGQHIFCIDTIAQQHAHRRDGYGSMVSVPSLFNSPPVLQDIGGAHSPSWHRYHHHKQKQT